MKTLIRLVAALVVAALAFACSEEEPTAAVDADVPKQHFDQEPTPFEDANDLVDAIGKGEYAERAGIVDEIAERAAPEPLRIPYAEGTAIPPDERAKLEHFAERVSFLPEISLRVVGCSAPIGAAEPDADPEEASEEIDHESVSQQRAESVAAALGQFGLDSDRLVEVVGLGEECGAAENVVTVTPVTEPDPMEPS